MLGNESTADPLASAGMLTASSVLTVLRPQRQGKNKQKSENSQSQSHSHNLHAITYHRFPAVRGPLTILCNSLGFVVTNRGLIRLCDHYSPWKGDPMRFGRCVLTVALLLSTCGLSIAASSEAREEALTLGDHSLQSELSEITTVRLHMKDGDFRIVGVDSDDITIRTEGKNADLAKHMKVRLQRSGDSLDLTFLNVPKNEVQVTIAIPKDTNLFARMRAGDLSVDGVAGDKDLELLAGDLRVGVPDPAEYGPVDLSVRFGDVSGRQFGDPRGLMGNSIKHDGTGKYRLHAHVFAGDLTLQP